ncbi:MAG: alpha-amylase family glycosyl hydrolase [Candidatus Thalassarchaeaceae archaeon]|nr:alpha-amylase family glycosyl hydrolase [Candidatus Thalassarchaeaceae archaeon]
MRFGKCLLLVALMLFSIIPLMAVDGGSAKSPVRVRDSLTEFSWEPNVGENQPSNVSIIGEWDWGNHTDLSFDVSAGKWTTSIILAEGMYCYKFVIGENDYRFDNDNSYRGYCGNYENSIVRVEDTSKPALSLDSFSINTDGLDATILYWAGSNQANPNTINATLMHDFTDATITGIWDASNWKFSLDIENLADGKYTLKVAGSDINNDEAEELLLPFWIGEQSNFIWDDALIYMVMTDRFVDGNSSNNGAATTAAQGADWQGGDFAGITQMIQSGYFDDLGVNALWLTPFNTAANGTGVAGDGQHEVSAYHGYWPIEPRGVDARLGTEAELEELISTAHEHGIRVMGDFVVNHVHEDHPYYTNNPDWFNQGCLCGTQNCGWTEHRLDCQFRTYMPDINWKNRAASEQMIADGLWWLERFDLDGARIDAVKHVDDLAIYNFGTQVKERFETMGTDYYLKGETAMGWAGHSLVDNQDEYGMINRYMDENGLDGQADFVLYHAVVDNVFTSGNMDYAHLDYWTARSQDQYSNGSTMVPFVGSHDVPRFTSRADSGTNDEWNQWQEAGLPGQPGNDLPYQAALQAYAWLLTTPGAPLIYQGDEYGEFGGADPDNRHMWRNNSNINSREFALMENISAIAQLRKDSDALRRGSYESLTNSTDTIAWSMTISSDQVVVAMNRGENSAGFDLELNWLANDSLNEIVMDENHSFTLGPHAVAIFLQPHDNNSSPIQGCTNSSATNYNPLAEVDDGSCQYSSPPVEGCTNSSATNYNPLAEIDDGSCQYPSPPVEGCTNSSATNYNPLAEVDNGTCEYNNPSPNNNSNNNTGNQTGNQTGNNTSNNTSNNTGSNQTGETPDEEEMVTCDACCGETVEVSVSIGCNAIDPLDCDPCNPVENNQDSTTETGEVASGSLVVYALLIILVLAIIGFVMMSIRRP